MAIMLLEDDGTTEATQSNATDEQSTQSTRETPTEQVTGTETQKQGEQTSEAGAEEAEGRASGTQQQSEPTINIGGKEVPLSRAQKALADYENDNAWKDKNRRESEELNARRERVKRMELLEPLIEKRPEILQTLFAPAPTRNYDTELAEHYAAQPDAFDSNATAQWMMKRDQLLLEKQQSLMDAKIESVRAKEEARLHNERVEMSADEKYVKTGKVTPEEKRQLTEWILENTNTPYTGKAPANAYDLAYRVVFADRYERDIREDAVKRATEPIKRAQSGGADAGFTQRTAPVSSSDAEDNAFLSRVKEMNRGSHTKL